MERRKAVSVGSREKLRGTFKVGARTQKLQEAGKGAHLVECLSRKMV